MIISKIIFLPNFAQIAQILEEKYNLHPVEILSKTESPIGFIY